MNKKIAILSLFLGFGLFAKAQVAVHKLLNVGYVYQNQSFLDLGGKLLFATNDDVLYRLGASAMMGSSQGNFVILPRVQGDILLNFQDHVDVYHSHYFLLGAEATTKYFAPKVGLSVLGLLDITAGYGFDFPGQTIHGKSLKGFNMNLGINVPLVMLHDLFGK